MQLRIENTRAGQRVEAIEQNGGIAAVIHVECRLEMSDDSERVLQFKGAAFDITVTNCGNGAAEVGN